MELGQHISHRYDEELEAIRNKVLKMGGLVEQQTQNAIDALIDKDASAASRVIKIDSHVNTMEVELDEECTQVIAKRQPAAGDLRLVISVIKIITDLERIGDEAKKIARFSEKLMQDDPVNTLQSELVHLGKLVLRVLNNALDSLARLDDVQALQVFADDVHINKEFDNLSRLLITHMMEDPRNIKQALRVNWCARSLERIGDHAQNICEYVIYLVKGEDVRHIPIEEIRSEYYDFEK